MVIPHFSKSFQTKVVQTDSECPISVFPYFPQSFPLLLDSLKWFRMPNLICIVFQYLTAIHIDLIQKDDYPAYSCAISPTAFLLVFCCHIEKMCDVFRQFPLKTTWLLTTINTDADSQLASCKKFRIWKISY